MVLEVPCPCVITLERFGEDYAKIFGEDCSPSIPNVQLSLSSMYGTTLWYFVRYGTVSLCSEGMCYGLPRPGAATGLLTVIITLSVGVRRLLSFERHTNLTNPRRVSAIIRFFSKMAGFCHKLLELFC